MTTDVEASARKRGSIRQMGACLQVRVSAGEDPSTGDRIVLFESVPIEKPGNERSERAAMNAAESLRARHTKPPLSRSFLSVEDPLNCSLVDLYSQSSDRRDGAGVRVTVDLRRSAYCGTHER